MRCFFKNIDYDYEKEYRIVLKVPKDIIDSCSIKGEIKAIGKNEKDQRYVDYGIHKECIKRVSICPFLSNSDIDEANCEIKDILRSNKLETVETVNRPIFPYVGSLTFRMGEEFVNNIALRILQHCYGNTYDRFSAHKSLYISDVKRTVRVDVEEVITDNEKCINLCSVTDGNFEKPIIQSIIKKRIKNVTNYKNEEFKSIELFVFFDEMRISVKSERFRAYIDEVRVYIDEVLNDYNEKFDVIYLGYPYGLVKYDVAAGSIQEISIDRTAYDEFYQEEKLKAEKL